MFVKCGEFFQFCHVGNAHWVNVKQKKTDATNRPKTNRATATSCADVTTADHTVMCVRCDVACGQGGSWWTSEDVSLIACNFKFLIR